MTAAEAALRAARASSVLDGGPVRLDDVAGSPDNPASAIRCSAERCGWPRRWKAAGARWSGCGSGHRCRRWPACTCWRPPTRSTTIGWVARAPSREVGPRLELLADLVTGRTRASAPVVAAVAHGELLTLKPFGSADGVVARAVSRLVTIATGLDPHGLGVPEVSWMRQPADYRDAARRFAEGTPDGVGAWLVLCCRAMQAGAQEALSIAESLPNDSSESVADRPQNGGLEKCKAGGDPKIFGPPPANTELGYQACISGLRGWPRRSCDTSGCNPTQRAVDTFRFSQLRRPATLLPLSRL